MNVLISLFFQGRRFLGDMRVCSQGAFSGSTKQVFRLGHIPGHTFYRLGLFAAQERFFLIREAEEGLQMIPLTLALFEDLWLLTQGHQIEWEYYPIVGQEVGGWARFLGEHDSLAMLFVPKEGEEVVIKQCSFLQEEVTERSEYELLSLASFGVPHPLTPYQVGVMPYQISEGKLRLLLITDSSGSRWIVPKGNQEPDLSPDQVATMEAMEEAGVLGVFRHDLHTTYETKRGYPVRLYPLQISRILSKWPEKEKRVRRLVTLKEARQAIVNPSLVAAVDFLSSELTKFL